MAAYHQTIVVGNVGKDPEMRFLQNGTAVTNFTVAVTEKWKQDNGEKKEKTTWYKVTAWRGLAETCKEYVHKGMSIMVVGTVSVSAYKNNAGEAQATLELTAQTVQFLGNKGGSQNRSEDEFAPPPSSKDIPF